MKKKLLSVLLALCMVTCLVPISAFAEGETEELPVCTCETACTAESMNVDCPVCGAEGALPENCGKCSEPLVNDAAPEPEGEENEEQPEGESSEAQPEASPVVLNGEGETPAAAATEVTTADELIAAVANGGTVKLMANVAISSRIDIVGNVTIDLNGHVIQSNGSNIIFHIRGGAALTLEDSDPGKVHYFTGGDLWSWDDTATGGHAVSGGVITGGRVPAMGSSNAGGVFINRGASFTMNGGSIVGCVTSFSGSYAGGVYNEGTFTMNGGSIQGCVGPNWTGAGGVCNAGTMVANGGRIANCAGDSSALRNEGTVRADSEKSGTVFEGNINTTFGSIDDSAKCSVTFDTGSDTLSTQKVLRGQTASRPGDPTKEGYDFVEWLKDGKAYDFSTPVTENITLTARWLVRLTGNGTAEDPYQIDTAEKLKLFRDIVNGSNGQTQNRSACAVLTSDIVLNDGTFDDDGNYTGGSNAAPERWTPMGDFISSYSGTFDGAGHSVKGLYYLVVDNTYDEECLAGLFGSIDGATVMNVTVNGYIRRGANPNNGANGMAGGIAGAATNSTILGCRNMCRIITDYDRGDIGGIAGAITDTTVENCRNDGYITMIDIRNSAAGGIVGNMSGGIVKNCINTGKVDGPKLTPDKYDYVGCGGVVGRINRGQIADCINIGEVNVADYGNAGGIVGYTNGGNVTVCSCYSVGAVTAENNLKAGGICGTIKSDSPTFENCYYSDSLGLKVVGSGEGTINNTTPKAAAQFADGTVLELLINGRAEGEHPWDTDCSSKQLTAGGPRLPVLAWQNLATNHEDTDKDHLCDYCEKAISNHEDTNKDHICDYCEKVISNHTGGVATCVGKAKCTFCGVEYGAIDPNHHEALTHVPEKSATTEAEGNKEYWHCEDCNKFFADDTAKTEINEKDTVIPKLLPEITPTPKPTATPTPVPTEQPAATPSPTPTAEPTTAPTATPTAIPTTVPTATPKPNVAENNPRTGDTANYTVWFALLGLSGAAAGMTIFAKKRRKNNQ